MKFKRFLVPVDYSEYAGAVLKYAADLARSLQGELILVHVVEPVVPVTPTYVAPMAGFAPVHKEMADGARHYLHELAPFMEGVPSRSIVRDGSPGDEIVAVASEEGADAIIMATHGRSGLSRLLMGSVTEHVVRNATVPVLVLRSALLLADAAAAAVPLPPVL